MVAAHHEAAPNKKAHNRWKIILIKSNIPIETTRWARTRRLLWKLENLKQMIWPK